MSKTNSAPTIGFVISSQITKWFSLFAFVIFLVGGLAIWATYIRITTRIDLRCDDPYKREITSGHYVINIRIESTNKECKKP